MAATSLHLISGLKNSNYNADPVLQESGVSILKVGNGEDLALCNRRWNFNSKQLVEPTTVTRCAVVNFSARCDTRGLIRDLIRCGGMKGINVEPSFSDVFEEKPQLRNLSAELIQSKLPGPPQFLLCILSLMFMALGRKRILLILES